ncbi:hypothetical protein BGV08_14960 [Clostridioides difficile]|nr:hypothetical protein PCZ31_2731 [Clostridioides difficile]CCL60817.1 hypothetical protein BN182_1700004 [Clostridioides difficile E9]PBF95192.1 hypothetical protein BGU77_13880 [Clostridioides difficile]PBG88720.1 hypothetical protein BGV08_14960 [Clostridioides difficile]PBI14528.1 hypothetical protein BGU58_12295 [Clostridioides difficile]
MKITDCLAMKNNISMERLSLQLLKTFLWAFYGIEGYGLSALGTRLTGKENRLAYLGALRTDKE